MYYFGLILIGIAAGIFGGLLGIGGATIVIPALIFFYGMDQHLSQGTTLAMLIPPVGLLAVWYYYKNGNVNIPVAAVLCVGFFFGGLIGAWLAHQIPDVELKKIFGVFLLIISVKLIFWS